MNTKLVLMILVLTALVSSSTSQANISHDPLKISCEGPLPSFTSDGATTLRFAVTAKDPVTIDDAHLVGNGWTIKASDFPATVTLDKGEKRVFTVSAVAENIDVPMTLHWKQDGRDRRLEVCATAASSNAYELGRHIPPGNPLVAALAKPVEGPLPAVDRIRIKEQLRAFREGTLEVEEPAGAKQTVLLTGMIAYEGGGGHTIAAKEVAVWIMGDGFFRVVETDLNGDFEIEVNLNGEMDLRLMVFAANSYVEVEEDNFMEDTWSFYGPLQTVTGSHHDFGVVMPSSSDARQAFHIANTIHFARSYYASIHGFEIPHVELHFPDDWHGSYYNVVFDEIHIEPGYGWNEGTVLHEYGHYWADVFTYSPVFDYCNGNCDTTEWYFDCGHCMWCQENASVAYSEGVAHFISRLATDALAQYEPYPDLVDHKRIQQLLTYSQDNCGQDPGRTEGYFAALLYDLVDTWNEDDPMTPGYFDELQDKADVVFQALQTHVPDYGGLPDTPWKVIHVLEDLLADEINGFWATARNNGYEIDEEGPGTVSLNYSTPVVGVLSPDATVFVSWNEADDDASGIAGYSISWSQGQSVNPDTLDVDVTGTTQTLSAALSPGSWYLNVRAIDRVGNWSTGYSSFGPFMIRIADPVDLEPIQLSGWQWPLVPSSELTSYGDVSVSSHLIGNGDTYWNYGVINSGEATIEISASAGLFIDGRLVDTHSLGSLAPGISSEKRNNGPVSVKGGRHMTRLMLDHEGVVAEGEENDNYWAGQWVWTPQSLATGPEVQLFEAPGNWMDDFTWFNWSQPFAPNCDGYRVNMQPIYHGALVYAASGTGSPDYDIRLHETVNFPENGFREFLAESARGSGVVDAVVINPANAGYVDHNLSVISRYVQSADYIVELIDSQYIGSDWGEYEVELVKGRMGHIMTFYSNAESQGKISIKVETNPANIPVGVSYYDPDFAAGGILDAEAVTVASGDDPVILDISQVTGTMGAFLVWREPNTYSINDPVSVTITIDRTLPDVEPHAGATWDHPLVPSNDFLFAPYANMPTPETLLGGQPTWFYGSQINASSASCALPSASILMNGFLAIPGGDLMTINPGTVMDSLGVANSRTSESVTMPGGRHTIAFVSDYDNVLNEGNELNNRQAKQWVWEPELQVLDGVVVAHPYVPAYTGGFADLNTEDENTPPYNCLGVRIPGYNPLMPHRFMSVCMVPQNGYDITMRLHQRSTGPQDGFTETISQQACSNWGDESEFIIVDAAQISGNHGYDVGLVSKDGTTNCLVQVEGSEILTGHHGTYGPNTLGASDLINIHEKEMTGPGLYLVRMVPADATVDLGFSLHMFQDEEYSDRDHVAETTASWDSVDGCESFYVGVPQNMTCAFAVWRRDQAALTTPVTYNIYIGADVSAVEGETDVPLATRLIGAAPNPFNPRTAIRYELAEEQQVSLTVYDVRGTPVCRLFEGVQAAGSREVWWDGRDTAGRRMASGAYFVRMRVNGRDEMVKVLMVK